MTIKVEREALLRVLSRQPPSYQLSDDPIPVEDDFLLVDYCSISSEDFPVEKLRRSTCDDDDSVDTLSTASLSDTDSECDRGVSFADNLVTDVWTRPYTPKEDISSLFYSTEDTARYVNRSLRDRS